jgi:excisionase family DNA binding protein
MESRWVSVDDVAEHLGVSRDTIYRWIDQRGLPAHRVGRLWKFQLSEIDEWVKSGGADAKNGAAQGSPGKQNKRNHAKFRERVR